MAYYHICEKCGAKLDPCEKCDCDIEPKTEKEQAEPKRKEHKNEQQRVQLAYK